MSAALIIVRLRWTLTMAALRKAPWQKVAFIVGIVLAVAIAAGVGVASWFVGLLPACGPAAGGSAVRDCGPGPTDIMAFPMIRAGLLPMACMAGLMWAVVPLTYTGDGSSLSPRRFALFGMRDRDLALGVLLSGLAGIPAITLFVALSLTSLSYRSAGALPVTGAIVGALLAMMTFVAVSKALIALATSLVRSRRGQGSLYLILVLFIVLFAEAPSILTGTGAMDALFAGGPARAIAMADILAWTPFGAPVQLPYDLMGVGVGEAGVGVADAVAPEAAVVSTTAVAGMSANPAWGLAAARVAVALATVTLCMLVIMWCVRHDRLTTGRNATAMRAKGLGAFDWMPATPSGAVSARVATYWRRDPRYLVGLLMPVVVFALLLVRGWSQPALMWGAPLVIAWVVPIIDSNSLAYDGRAFTMQASIGVRGRDDRIGRVRVSAALGIAFVALSVIACIAMNAGAGSAGAVTAGASVDGGAAGVAAGGDASGRPVRGMDALGVLSNMAQSAGAGAGAAGAGADVAGAGASLTAASPALAVFVGGAAVAVLLCGIGLAQVLSCVLMYPVATADKPFSSPQGRAAAQGFFPLAQLFGVYVCCIPTIATTVVLLLTDRLGLLWVAGVVGVVNGVAGLIVGVWLGGRILDARTPAIVRTLDNFASLAK